MEITVTNQNGAVFVTLGGEIDHHEASTVRNELDDLILYERPGRLVFDFSNVKFMDSSGIGLVLGRHRLMKSIGGDTEICGASSSVEKLFVMSGVNRIIDINK